MTHARASKLSASMASSMLSLAAIDGIAPEHERARSQSATVHFASGFGQQSRASVTSSTVASALAKDQTLRSEVGREDD